jgi:acetoacetyl-CoA synthetase
MLEPLGEAAGAVLWTPSPERVRRSQLTRYTDWLAAERGLRFDSYESLRSWSITELETFWGSIWDYFEVRGERPRGEVLVDRRMPGAQWFPGARLNYAEHVFRDRDPGRTAILHGSETAPLSSCDWAALESLTRRIRAGLVAAGVGRGDRVAALMPNCSETVALLLASASLGAVFSCVAPEMGAASVVGRFSQIDPAVLVCVDGYRYNGRDFDLRETVARVRDALPSLARAVVLHSADWDAFIATDGPLAFELVPFDHPLWILYSSGTTGAPKAIVHSHGGILLEHLKKLHLHVDLGAEDRLFWFTTTGWMMWNFLVGGLLTQAAIVLYDGSPKHPDLGVLWDVCADAGVTVFGCSAGYLSACMADGVDPRAGRDLSALRAVGSTGSPLPGPVFDWVYDRVGRDTWLFSSSGGTDVCTSFVGGVPTLPVRRGELQARSLGAAIEAWDPHGRPLIGQVGELVLTAPMPSMPIGFWGDDDGHRLRESYFGMYPGVWRHGDWIEINAHGGVVISGRSDSTINRGGIRFGTSEIYQVVLADPDIIDALVVDVPQADGSSWLPLFVVMRAGAQLDDAVTARLRQRLLRDCSPRHLPDPVIAIDEVPRTLSGKPLEVPVKRILMGARPDQVLDRPSLANPSALEPFVALAAAGGSRAGDASSPTDTGGSGAGDASSPTDTGGSRAGDPRLGVDHPADGVLRLTIDNAPRRNALDLGLLAALADAVERSDARCIVIRGIGDVFCSGYDLHGLDGAELDGPELDGPELDGPELDGPGFAARAETLVANPRHRLFDALERSDATVIAQLGGAAIGGGLELAICCDLRFAAEEVTVSMPAGALGLTYSHTGLRRFVETVGLAATKELFLLGRRVDATRALALGIVTEVVCTAELEGAVLAAAAEITGHSPSAQSANKRILERLREAGRALDPAIEAELLALHSACFQTPDLREGITAFNEHREPRWGLGRRAK